MMNNSEHDEKNNQDELESMQKEKLGTFDPDEFEYAYTTDEKMNNINSEPKDEVDKSIVASLHGYETMAMNLEDAHLLTYLLNTAHNLDSIADEDILNLARKHNYEQIFEGQIYYSYKPDFYHLKFNYEESKERNSMLNPIYKDMTYEQYAFEFGHFQSEYAGLLLPTYSPQDCMMFYQEFCNLEKPNISIYMALYVPKGDYGVNLPFVSPKTEMNFSFWTLKEITI